MDGKLPTSGFNPMQNRRQVPPINGSSTGMGVTALANESEDQVTDNSPDATLTDIRKKLGLSPVDYSGSVGLTKSPYSSVIQTTRPLRKRKQAIQQTAQTLYSNIAGF